MADLPAPRPHPGEESGTTAERRASERVAVVAEVELRFADLEGLIREHAGNLSLGGMFVPTSRPQPVGTPLRFDLRLDDGTPVVRGSGVVAWVREAARERRVPSGMGIRFTELDPLGREIIFKVVDLFIQTGGVPFDLEDGALP